MKRLLTILLALMVPALAQAKVDCSKNPVYCDILTLKPSVDHKFARTLSNAIAKYSRKFGLDPKVSVAIAMQESSFENTHRMGTILTKTNHVVHGITDMGVFQIHIETIASLRASGYTIDVERIKTDVDYQAFWHAKILRSKIAVCKAQREKLRVEEGHEWSCYHSFTHKERLTYVEYVEPYLDRITIASTQQ